MESEESSLTDNYLDNYSTEIDSRTNNSEEDSFSQNSVEEENMMADFEKKIRNFSKLHKTGLVSDQSETSESEIPEDAQQLMKKMKKKIRAISSNFPQRPKSAQTANTNLKWFDDPKPFAFKNMATAKKTASPSKRTAPSKEEASFQKADRPPVSDPNSVDSDGRQFEAINSKSGLPEPPLSEASHREVEKEPPPAEVTKPPDPGKVPRAVLEINSDQDFDANRKVIKYLEQLREAEIEIDRRIQLKGDVSRSEVEAINSSRDALLKEYGYEYSNEGVTEENAPVSSVGSEDDEDAPMKEEIVRRILRATLGKQASDVDLSEIMRSDKWKKAVEKEKSASKTEIVEGRLEKRRRQFEKIFEGVKRPFSAEDIQKIHDTVSPWVHNQNRKLDNFIEAKKYSPGYLLNEWDGRLSDDSEEPDFGKYRDKWLNTVDEEENLESTEERIPTLQDNSGFLFPTPLTKSFGKNDAFVRGNNSKPDPKAVVELVANEVKRKKDAEKSARFLNEHWQPPYAFSDNRDNGEAQQQ